MCMLIKIVTTSYSKTTRAYLMWNLSIVKPVIAFHPPRPGSLSAALKTHWIMYQWMGPFISARPWKWTEWLQLKAIAAKEINWINAQSTVHLCLRVLWVGICGDSVCDPCTELNAAFQSLLLLHSFEKQHSFGRQKGQRSGSKEECGCCWDLLHHHVQTVSQAIQAASRYVCIQWSMLASLGTVPSSTPNSCSNTCVHSWVHTTASPQGIASILSACGN